MRFIIYAGVLFLIGMVNLLTFRFMLVDLFVIAGSIVCIAENIRSARRGTL